MPYLLLKRKKMKSLSNNNFTATMPYELKFNNATYGQAKKPRYIYTEEDLGEGILDVGVYA